ncbi:hypothetical protein [Bradyrhizobium sp. UFLA03-84]|uniref:hypothetical protein n=1 Tax=Bradyrhizobium sp. UFLA03-84 TaxID=418599 RepID=UPI001177E4DA|nr:hypothetical protein [Bradyrhizobium sp. UFLA03-84]
MWPRENVAIVEANTLKAAVFVNRGDRDVFISHLLFVMPGRDNKSWSAPQLPVNERLAPGAFLKKDWTISKLDAGEFIKGASPREFEAAIDRATNHDPCYELVFFGKSDFILRTLMQISTEQLNTFPVEGDLEYWAADGSTTPRHVHVEGNGLVRRCLSKTP